MNAVDASEHYDKPSHSTEQSPSLLTIILDTNPAAWSLLSSTLPLSSAVADLLVFINAHLAANYTNKVAVIASHCDKAQWLYPSPTEQKLPRSAADRHHAKRQSQAGDQLRDTSLSDSAKRLKLNGPSPDTTSIRLNLKPPSSSVHSGSKYRPFRLVEEELLHNLTLLLSSTSPEAITASTSTMIAGALTLALSYINRESILVSESLIGTSLNTGNADGPGPGPGEGAPQTLQSRILLISASPSTDLAHQYIPIMNAIFACQRLSIPIDILQLPLPHPDSHIPSTAQAPSRDSSNPNSTVFLQQAADATHGIFIPAHLSPSANPSNKHSKLGSTTTTAQTTAASQALLTYLLTSFLPSPSTRSAHLILPTRIDVDFRAACFCHRNVVSVGFVCSICLSIFCEPPERGECLTCGTVLAVSDGVGRRPVVAGGKRKTKQSQGNEVNTR
ncbi:transcription factor TFIIH subunit Tfb4 [Cladophialophora carrionii]|uniref:General transcription and DNA repair factor IIH subunit TFB4 n=1 Tax=Cladophialophora carrionii TaxID=86049 RepID=A0A1C1C9R0_9EURO|nr:transcription factor TFIIH subunit Tfb4 [Cladophialophora carrionii]